MYDVIVISGFSGSGKGTLVKQLVKSHKDLKVIKSYTTRKKRGLDDDYVFVSKEEFMEKANNDFFLEWNEYGSEFYGTPRNEIIEKDGKLPVLLEVNLTGARKITAWLRKRHIEYMFVFIFVDPETLWYRLNLRNTETCIEIKKRLQESMKEVEKLSDNGVNFVVPNYDIEIAYQQLLKILDGECEGFEFRVDPDLFKAKMLEVLAAIE